MDLEPDAPSDRPKNVIRSTPVASDDYVSAAVPIGREPLKPAGSFSPIGEEAPAAAAPRPAAPRPAEPVPEAVMAAPPPAPAPARSSGGPGAVDKAFGTSPKNRDMQVNRIREIACAGCRHNIDVSKMAPLSQEKCPSCGAPFQVPCQIGQYLLVKRVASGAMGTVFTAFDEVLHRQVALKIINASPSAADGLYQSALRESRILASLNHANIAQIYSMSEDQGQPYITMELVDGPSVLELIRRGPPLKEAAGLAQADDMTWTADGDPRFAEHRTDGRLREWKVVQIMIGACEGLSYAYRLGYIHRDLKPGNLLVDRWGNTKIIDWGLAEMESKQVEGKVMGSPYYMPPEIARGKIADCRADIFSLGASMYHMLAGSPPFQGASPKEVILRRFKEAAPDLMETAGVHPYVSSLVAWTLNVNPDDRPAGYRDLIDKLRKAMEKLVDAGMGPR